MEPQYLLQIGEQKARSQDLSLELTLLEIRKTILKIMFVNVVSNASKRQLKDKITVKHGIAVATTTRVFLPNSR